MRLAMLFTVILLLAISSVFAWRSISNGKILRVGHTDPVAPFSTLFHSSSGGINFIKLDTSVDGLRALKEGDIDLALVGSTAVAIGLAQDQESRLIAAPMFFPKEARLFVRKSKSFKSPADLTKLKIGVPFISTVHHQLLSYLSENSIDYRDVELFDLRPFEAVEAWDAGVIDAAIMWEPMSLKIKPNANEYILSLKVAPSPSFLGLVVRSEVLVTHRKAIEDFVSSVYGENKSRNEARVVDLVSKIFDLSQGKVKSIFKANSYPERLDAKMRESVLNELVALQAFLKQIGFQKRVSINPSKQVDLQ